MKNSVKIAGGIAIIGLGILWILSIIGLLNINFMFDGWWTLFIIVPSVIGLLTEPHKGGSIWGICLGVLLLLAVRGTIDWNMFWKLGLAVMMILIGFSIILFRGWDKEAKVEVSQISRDGKNIRRYDVSFGKQFVAFDGEDFQGADVNASFGAVQLDLRKAFINDDVVVKLECSFCGVEILVPEGAVVKVASQAAFGGIKDERRYQPSNGGPVIYIDGKVSFAGVEIK